MCAYALKSLCLILSFLLMPMTLLGGIGAGIWLAVLNEWWAIGLGLVMLFLGPLLLFIAFGIGSMFAGDASALTMQQRRSWQMLSGGVFGGIYSITIITSWCMAAFHLFTSMASESAMIPMLIWAYSASITPLFFLMLMTARSGPGDPYGTAIEMFFAMVAYVLIALLHFFGEANFLLLAALFVGIMLLGVALNMGNAAIMQRTVEG